ncbi:MAG: QueT transporter family protein [Lachnospiraceae bacterium]|nr:QueT transporter family protein [Lachnospiraceae bacterium]
MKNKKVLFLTQAAMIAALYVVLTEISNIFGLASFAIQIRFSEALTILPFFTPAAIPGLFAGCIISNLLVSANIFDIIFGSLATLSGAFFTYLIGRWSKRHSGSGIYATTTPYPPTNKIKTSQSKQNRTKIAAWFAPIPPILSNTLIIPFVLKYAYGLEPLWLFFLTVFVGEFISCAILGMPLLFLVKKYARHIFKE